MHLSEAEFLEGISGFLGAYYLVLAVSNALMAYYLWKSGRGTVICNCFRFPFTTAGGDPPT